MLSRNGMVVKSLLVTVLDLGCGTGRDLTPWGVSQSDVIAGLDIDRESLAQARERFPCRGYFQGRGEALPFYGGSFDRVISAVAMPYMNIQETLAEIHRTLSPEGTFSASLHLPGFTLAELARNAFPRPLPVLFRLYVIANGLWFHLTGRTKKCFHRTESFQTERGMRIALNRAGFANITFRRSTGPAGETFFVSATKGRDLIAGCSRSTSRTEMPGRVRSAGRRETVPSDQPGS